MTVRRLEREMPNVEFLRWIAFFEKRAAIETKAHAKAEKAGQRRRAPGR